MNKFSRFSLFTICSLLCSFGLSYADKIITKDGSQIVGKLVLFEDGNLTFKTKFAGEIKISTSEISSLLTDNEISVRLDDNRTFESKILLADDSQILIEQNQLRQNLIKFAIFGQPKVTIHC